ncbi:MAG: hypothetical protein DWQ36_17220 [Acidobacteria bacterium]|nr:MAG: hypothetical protein DWQ30_05315 [Acidobacteriota bacterium]REK04589.1 MAG: hypothetical protein DWQ36_17220 [Acidobacteriota bacterium]
MSTTSTQADETKNFLGRELPYRALYVAVIAILAVCVVFAILLLPMVRGFASWSDATQERARTRPTPVNTRPVGPLLQSSPEGQLIDYDREIDRELASYGWIDENGGIAKIPLERARELILQEGLGGIADGASGSDQSVPSDTDPAATDGGVSAAEEAAEEVESSEP